MEKDTSKRLQIGDHKVYLHTESMMMKIEIFIDTTKGRASYDE